jgi:hypothetical protein
VAKPDRQVPIEPPSCGACGGKLACAPGTVASYGWVQVFDLPAFSMAVTEYRMMRRRCGYGQATTAALTGGGAGWADLLRPERDRRGAWAFLGEVVAVGASSLDRLVSRAPGLPAFSDGYSAVARAVDLPLFRSTIICLGVFQVVCGPAHDRVERATVGAELDGIETVNERGVRSGRPEDDLILPTACVRVRASVRPVAGFEFGCGWHSAGRGGAMMRR